MRPLNHGLGFGSFRVRQVKAVAQQDQVGERYGRTDGFETRTPFLHGLEISRARVPRFTAVRECGQGAKRHKIQRQLVVRVRQQAPHLAAQSRLTARLRSAVKTTAVIIIGVEIIPDDRLPAHHGLQLAHVRHGNLGRNDFGTRPRNLDVQVQLASERGQVILAAQFLSGHSTAIGGWAKEKRRARTAAGLTYRALAARCGLSHSYPSHLEKGERRTPRLDRVVAIAAALDALSPQFLIPALADQVGDDVARLAAALLTSPHVDVSHRLAAGAVQVERPVA
ncbi:MAG: helix-turn-helix transcriptional regulator, partial [Acidobacteria bacterium]|nr:helix-turn-helix transcriptional regulator [Acidobacteriota bacterium]